MKILSLQASNFKKLTAVEITPEGNIVTLTGNSGAGKSSVLDAIECALTGASVIPERPIREGANRASVVCALPGMVVTRNFTAKGSSLTVKMAEGGPRKSPQTMLDEITGALSFDPLSFSRMDSNEQVKTLASLAKVDFTVLNAEHQTVYESRTVVNRQADALAARVGGCKVDYSLPEKVEEVGDLVRAKEMDDEFNRRVDVQETYFGTVQTKVERAVAAVTEAEAQIKSWERCLKERQEQLEKVRAERAALPPVPVKRNVSGYLAKIAEVESLRNKVMGNNKLKESFNALIDLRAASEASTMRLEEIKAEKQAILEKAQFPLPGLSFTEGGVTYRGLPFSQLSSGEKLRISVAIGMAMNPTLKVIFVRDGSLLDQTGLQIMADLAKAHDYQVWIEDNRSSDPTAILIADGHVVPKTEAAPGVTL